MKLLQNHRVCFGHEKASLQSETASAITVTLVIDTTSSSIKSAQLSSPSLDSQL